MEELEIVSVWQKVKENIETCRNDKQKYDLLRKEKVSIMGTVHPSNMPNKKNLRLFLIDKKEYYSFTWYAKTYL